MERENVQNLQYKSKRKSEKEKNGKEICRKIALKNTSRSNRVLIYKLSLETGAW